MRFQDLFAGYTRAHGKFRVLGASGDKNKVQGKAFTVQGAPRDDDWKNHVAGKDAGLGMIPLRDDNETLLFAAIDIDIYPLDHAALERDIAKLPLVMTKSKSGGAHLWLFFKEPCNAKIAISKMSQWASALGYGGTEVFPKQYTRQANDDVGNWINLPYFGSTRRCFFEGNEVDLETFLTVAESRRITEKILRKINVVGDTEGQFADGPPCLQIITAARIGEGGRNNTLFNVALYWKEKDQDNWQDKVREYNQKFVQPPIPEHEVNDLLKSAGREKGYCYTCNKHPLKQHCNRQLCITREYGISQGNDQLNVELSGLTKITTNPPRWLINIDGVRCELGDTSDLLVQGRFERFTVETIHKVLTPVSPKRWKELVQDQLNKVEVVEAPIEATPQGQLIEHLMAFIEVRGQSETRDALANGRVWIDANRAYFRSRDFFQYLKREGFRELTAAKVFSVLRDRGLQKDRWNIKGKNVACWILPIETQQSEAFDAPKFNDPFGDEK